MSILMRNLPNAETNSISGTLVCLSVRPLTDVLTSVVRTYVCTYIYVHRYLLDDVDSARNEKKNPVNPVTRRKCPPPLSLPLSHNSVNLFHRDFFQQKKNVTVFRECTDSVPIHLPCTRLLIRLKFT